MSVKIGYITVSNRVMIDGRKITYLYREEPDNEGDSGWRVFAGDESQEYVDDPCNFSLYNASTLIELDPTLKFVLIASYPIAFEREADSDSFVEIDEPTQ